MSQAGRILQDAPLGAGILTIEGDVGPAAGPDGIGNFFIVGAGGITTTSNPATNTLTVTNNVIAAQFDANVGSAFPAAGILQLLGTANQIDTTAAGNTVTFSLPNVLVAPGSLTVTTNLDVLNNTRLRGAITTDALALGVVQVDGATNVYTTAGLNGQVLIGSAGAAALWGNITSAAGSITITNGPNTINLEQNSQYVADAGNAVPVGGVLNVVGGANITTSGALNTLTVALEPNVTIAGNFVAGGDITGSNLTILGDINATLGTIFANDIAAVGNLVTNGFISAGSDIFATLNVKAGTGLRATTGGVIVNAGGMDITGNSFLRSLPIGVVQVLPTTQLTSTNAALDGEILIGEAGVNPTWHRLTAGPGISITNAPHAITINNTTAAQAAFRAHNNAGIPYLATTGAADFSYGASAIMTEDFDPDNLFYPGDGVGSPANFQAPYDGIYSFTISCSLGYDAVVGPGTAYWQSRWIKSLFVNLTVATYTVMSITGQPTLGANNKYVNIQATQVVQMSAGQFMVFRHRVNLFAPASPAYYQHIQFGPDYAGNGEDYISGYLVRRL